MVVGHADSTGGDQLNVQLSQERARAVVARLRQLGIDEARMMAVAAGQDVPFAENESSAGRAENRRVEFHVLSDPSAGAR